MRAEKGETFYTRLCMSTVFYSDCKTFHQNPHTLMEYAISIEIYCASSLSWNQRMGNGSEVKIPAAYLFIISLEICGPSCWTK